MIQRVVLVAGTRPEFVKLHPLALALAAERIPLALVTTGQHRGRAMRDTFFEQLEWPCAVVPLARAGDDPLALLARLVRGLPRHLEPGDLVVVEGDTTSVLAASLVANKLRLPLAHVEAGLRSFDLRMPEEHNRRVCDHLADYLFAPTAFDAGHLAREACTGAVFVVGNTVLDAVRQNAPRAPATTGLGRGYLLVTLHRQENVDDGAFLRDLVDLLGNVALRVVFPIHPRTRDRLRETGLWPGLERLEHVRATAPLDYLAFLAAMRDAAVVLTDSGGVQEEATAPEIRRPVVVLRRSTERVPAIEAGYSALAPDATTALRLASDRSWFRPASRSPFGDGHAAEAIVAALRSAVPIRGRSAVPIRKRRSVA